MCAADGFYIWCGLQQGMFEEFPPPSNRLEMTAAFTQTLKANSLSYWGGGGGKKCNVYE